jgi:uncharacterized zinc-type alcohol dehydrogenase-like protein
MIPTQGYAALSPNAMLTPFSFERRELGPEDVLIEILYCGVCHSDIHQVRDEWGGAQFPMVPGHEIVGRVVRTGPDAKKHNPGDIVGVGCMVDSCQNCEMCYRRMEQYCESSCSFTYNSTVNLQHGLINLTVSLGRATASANENVTLTQQVNVENTP